MKTMTLAEFQQALMSQGAQRGQRWKKRLTLWIPLPTIAGA